MNPRLLRLGFKHSRASGIRRYPRSLTFGLICTLVANLILAPLFAGSPSVWAADGDPYTPLTGAEDAPAPTLFLPVIAHPQSNGTPITNLPAESPPFIDPALLERIESEGQARVIIRLAAPEIPLSTTEGGLAATADTQQAMAAVRMQVLGDLAAVAAVDYTTVMPFITLPLMALVVNADQLQALSEHPQVVSIVEDGLSAPTLAESIPLINADDAWAAGYAGANQVVAVLDTGVDTSHPMLAGKVVAEACFSASFPAEGASSFCPNGQTQQIGPGSGVNCPMNIVGCDHGTHVAGIAVGKSDNLSGVARDAGVIAVQVFSHINNVQACTQSGYPTPCVLTYDSAWIAALEYLYTVRQSFAIASANMSLGGGGFTNPSDCDTRGIQSGAKQAVDTLRSVGIAVVAASGNSGYINALGYPGCISSVVSVGSSTKVDTVATGYSNSASFLSLLAPGHQIVSSVPGGTASMNGTSMASPHVAGAWAVLKSKMPNASVNQVLNALATTGVPITDPRNGITKPRIQVNAALAALDGGGGSQQCTGTIRSEVMLTNVYGQQIGEEIFTTNGIVVIQPPLRTASGQQEANPFNLLIQSQPVANAPGEIMIVSTTEVDELLFPYWSYTLNGTALQGTLSDNHTAEAIAQNLITIPSEIAPNLWMPFTFAMANGTTMGGQVSANQVTLQISGNTVDLMHPFQIDISASGNCMPPGSGEAEAQISPTSLNFGEQEVGADSAARTVTLSNAGDAPLSVSSVSVTGDAFADYLEKSETDCVTKSPLQPGQSCVANMVFTPATTGTRNATLRFTTNAPGSPHQVPLTGVGITGGPPAAPEAQISPTNVNFGEQEIGTDSPAHPVTLSNVGNAPLSVSSVSVAGDASADYLENSGTDCISKSPLQPGQSCVANMIFTPASTGTRNATLRFTTNALGSPHQVPLTGIGVNDEPPPTPKAQVNPTNLNFGEQEVGSASAARTVTLTNSGNASLTVDGVTFAGIGAADFRNSSTINCVGAGGTALNLAPGDSCTVSVVFAPATTGTRSATLRFASNAPGSPHQVSLTGVGIREEPPVEPEAQVSPASLNFGEQEVGSGSAARTVTLSNTGSTTLIVDAVTFVGAEAADFRAGSTINCVGAGGAALNLAPGDSCTVRVVFTPAMTGTRNATLRFATDAPDSPHLVSLKGTGIAAKPPATPEVQVNPTSLNFGEQEVGSASGTRTVTLTNSGNASLTIVQIAITGDFNQTHTCSDSLAPSASCTISVIFTPGDVGRRNGTLTVTTNALESPHVVTLRGDGIQPPPPEPVIGEGTVNIPAGVSGTLISENGQFSMTFPAQTQAMTVTVSEATRPPALGNYNLLGKVFDITAAGEGRGSITTFDPPFTMVVTYMDADWQAAGIGAESDLNLYYWDGAVWQALLPCSGCSHNMAANRITLVLDHLTQFALLANGQSEVFLPLVSP